jgi:amino acid transporter
VARTTLGSGWLFGAFVAVTIAWPAALIGWLLAAVIMAPLALVYGFTAAGGFFVHGGGGPTQAIFSAITAGGIAFALMGFEGALEVGGRAPTPSATWVMTALIC